eukprot:874766-Rhodomonas_salina.2
MSCVPSSQPPLPFHLAILNSCPLAPCLRLTLCRALWLRQGQAVTPILQATPTFFTLVLSRCAALLWFDAVGSDAALRVCPDAAYGRSSALASAAADALVCRWLSSVRPAHA